MNLYFGKHPDDFEDIRTKVRDWESATAMIGMICLVAANGPEGFSEEDLDAAMIGAEPADVVLMVLGSVARLVKQAWPDMDWE